MSRVYISGRIGNLPKEVYSQKFIKAKNKLKNKFDIVITPLDAAVELESIVSQPNYNWYLLADITHLVDCDCIYMLNDWRQSPGAKAERAYAKACKMKIIYQPWYEKN